MINKFRPLDLFIIVIFLSGAFVSVDMFRRDLLNTFSLQNVEPVGTVIIKKNTVQRKLADRIIWDRLINESPVYIGDLIRVADVSAATLNILNNSIELEENTLVRIMPAADGEGFHIELTQGSIAVFSEIGAGKITLNAGGREVDIQPGTVISAVVNENRMPVVEVTQTIEEFVRIRDSVPREIPVPTLISPAANSNIKYQENKPAMNFQWTPIEEAVSYVLEVSDKPDFSGALIQKVSSTEFASDSSLDEGTWFWRVTPVFPPVFTGTTVRSTTGFFSIEKTEEEKIIPVMSVADWLMQQAPSMEIPSIVPFEIVPVHLVKVEPEPEPEAAPIVPDVIPAAAVTPPAPPPRLSAPQNMRPARGTKIDQTQLINQRSISFTWAPVQGANAYNFTLYHQTASGRRQIVRTTTTVPNYTLNNLRLLDRGTFIWQVEAVNNQRGVTQRRGEVVENLLTIEFSDVTPIQIEDTGILYGD